MNEEELTAVNSKVSAMIMGLKTHIAEAKSFLKPTIVPAES
jgi:hypothetical protein